MVITQKVVFRKEIETGEILAIYSNSYNGSYDYTTMGQQSGITSHSYIMQKTKPASFQEYKEFYMRLSKKSNSYYDNVFIIIQPCERLAK